MKSKITRILALLLVICACLVLASCAKEDNAEKKTLAEKIDEKVPKKFTRGKINGNVYECEFIGLKLTKPDDWYFYSDDEITKASGTTKSLLEDPEAFEKASEGEIMDMFVSTLDGATNVTVTFDKGNALTSLDKSIDASVDLLKDAYKQMGFTCTASEKSDAKLGDLNFRRIQLTIDLGTGISMKQYCYFKLQNQYLTSITFTTSSESEASLTSMVTAIK